MNSRQLEYVVTVAEEGSFSKAAKKLIISQPSLSQYVQKLEQELGTQLFIRSSPLKLTYEGRIYVKSAKRILSEEDMMRKTIFDIVNDKIGEITVGAGQYNNAFLLPHIVQRFQEKYPRVKVIMKEAIEPFLFEMLDKGDCDLIFTTMKPENDLEQYEVIQLRKEDYLLAVPAKLDPMGEDYEVNMINEKDRIFPLADINQFKMLPFIFIGNEAIALYKMLENLCKKEKIKPVTEIDCANITVVLHLVSAGAGISIVPSSAVFLYMDENIHFYKIEQIKNSRKLNLVYVKEKHLANNAKHFIEISKEMLFLVS